MVQRKRAENGLKHNKKLLDSLENFFTVNDVEWLNHVEPNPFCPLCRWHASKYVLLEVR